ncbi:MAG: hypothetical protein AAGU11_03960, partial [Syntrophobacteraceae bacterium]
RSYCRDYHGTFGYGFLADEDTYCDSKPVRALLRPSSGVGITASGGRYHDSLTMKESKGRWAEAPFRAGL